MANDEQLEILSQGSDVWNQWRKYNPNVTIDLSNIRLGMRFIEYVDLVEVNLSRADLSGAILTNLDLAHSDCSYADFSGITLTDADLNYTNFSYTNLNNADLMGVDLDKSSLRGAKLKGAKLIGADLQNADLRNADFTRADLSDANLSGANLTDGTLYEADLNGTNFSGANLKNTTFQRSTCANAIFINLDFSTARDLDTVSHYAPSTLSVDTIFRAQGKIPENFLRGCGVPETLITFLPSMMEEAIQFYSCFISYSHADKAFAQLLHDRLQGQGIRCWLDEHQLNPGDKLHETIYSGIRVYDKVILCCSEKSLKSWWVKKEFENMIAKEEDFEETLLIPVALDNYLFDQSAAEWLIGEIRKKRLVQDFKGWENHKTFEAAFTKVVKALRTDGGKPPPPPSKLTPRK